MVFLAVWFWVFHLFFTWTLCFLLFATNVREIKHIKIGSGRKPLDFTQKLSNSVVTMQRTIVTGLKRI